MDSMQGIQQANQETSIASQGFGTDIATASELQTDFLNLLIAQLSNQDPLSPMDNDAMVQQLATFSQLEQLERVNTNLVTSQGLTQSQNNTLMMGVAGKRVTVVGNAVNLDDGEASRSLVRIPERGSIYPRIVDSTGQDVVTLPRVVGEPGFNTIEWDGKDADGNPVPDGEYFLEVSAKNTDNEFMPTATFRSGIVETVQFDNNFVYFEIDGRLYSPGEVVEVGIVEGTDRPSDGGGTGGTDGPNDDGGTQGDDNGGGGSGNGGVVNTTPPGTDTGPGVVPTPDPDAMVFGGLGGRDRSPWEALLRIR